MGGPVASGQRSVAFLPTFRRLDAPHSVKRTLGLGLLGVALSSATVAGVARAEEPRMPTEPFVMKETAVELLELASSFDEGDMFDVSLRLGFEHESRSAAIRRETNIAQPGLSNAGYTSDAMDVARYFESTQRLVPEINVGLYRDFQLKFRMPLILANNRRLEARNGSNTQSPPTAGFVGEQLFSPQFESPTRSGIEYLAVGLDVGIMNQFRKPQRPNWVMGIEARFNISEPMHACNASPKDGQVRCANEADQNRNGKNDTLDGEEWGELEGDAEGDFNGSYDPGVSRGTTALEGHAYVSKRINHVEPYTGVSALFEFQNKDTAYGAFDLEGALVNHPPIRGSVVAGISVIPWEQPEVHRRFVLDFRVRATYVSEGRDYSELFDALGSSDAASLRSPNYRAYTANTEGTPSDIALYPSVVDPSQGRVHFTGLTDVQQHGDYEMRAQLTWQAGRYVKFDVGSAWRIIQEHFITFDKACNADLSQQVARSGPCKVQVEADGGTDWESGGLPNPHHRKVINDPGQRFKVETSHGLRAWVRASVLF